MERIYIFQFGSTYNLENNTDTVYKLNTVSETINEMSRNYKEEENEQEEVENKDAFVETVIEKLETMKDNVLYDDLVDESSEILDQIFTHLTKNNYISKEDIIKIYEDRNEYLLGFNDFDTNLKVEEDIKKCARLLNDTYKIGKENNLWKQKIKENKKVISSQLDGVSKAISDVANSIFKGNEGFAEEKKQIKILAKQKEIDIEDIKHLVKMTKNIK